MNTGSEPNPQEVQPTSDAKLLSTLQEKGAFEMPAFESAKLEVDKQRLALDERKASQDYKLKTDELKLKEHELKSKKEEGDRLFTAVTTPIFAALLALTATVAAAFVQSFSALNLERNKEQHELVLKMITVNDVKQARANLKFLAENKLVSDELAETLVKSKDIPLLGSSGLHHKDITSLSDVVDQLQSAFAAGYAALDEDLINQQQRQLVDRRASVSLTSACFVPVSSTKAPCTLKPQADSPEDLTGATPPVDIDTYSTRTRTMTILATLQEYHHALADITTSTDLVTYDAAVTRLSRAVASFLSISAAANAPVAAATIPGWVATPTLEARRFSTLKVAVNVVDQPAYLGEKPMEVIANVLRAGLTSLIVQRRLVLSTEANARAAHLGPSLSEEEYRLKLAELQSIVATLEGLRRVDATVAFTTDGLAKAHEALARALNDPKRDYTALLVALDRFRDKTPTLQPALAATIAAPAVRRPN